MDRQLCGFRPQRCQTSNSSFRQPLALTCAAALLEVEEPSRATVALGTSHARLAAALTRLIAVERLGAEGVAVAGDADPAGGQAVSLRLQETEWRERR